MWARRKSARSPAARMDFFTFVNLLPGQYRIDVEKSGSSTLCVTMLRVDVQQSTRVDAALQVAK